MNSYRRDGRSKKQFEADIKSHTMEERALFLLWLDLVEKDTGKRPEYEDTGCGKDGEYLEDNHVSTSPDFEVKGYGKIEVKFSKKSLKKVFHLKENQVRAYIKHKATILMINGADEEVPVFTMIKTAALKRIVEECDVIPWQGFGGKPSYRIPLSNYLWRPLK